MIKLIILAALAVVIIIMLFMLWRRSRQHIGIARPDGPINAVDPTVTPDTVSYKQVVAPGSQETNTEIIPVRDVEDALAKRPGAPEPGQTFTPAGPDQPPEDPAPKNS